jgi:hypothetical protein
MRWFFKKYGTARQVYESIFGHEPLTFAIFYTIWRFSYVEYPGIGYRWQINLPTGFVGTYSESVFARWFYVGYGK